MDHIEKLAAECMKDMDEDEDEGLEEDTELLVYIWESPERLLFLL